LHIFKHLFNFDITLKLNKMTHSEFSETIKKALEELGIDATYSTSETDYGRSDYFVFWNSDSKLKVRVSDHSVENTFRMGSELLVNVRDAQRIESIVAQVERFMFPERFEKRECKPRVGSFLVNGKFYEYIKN
jgi:hypothetical protein